MKQKKSGFTLIELLSIVVVLAIVMLIAIPQISKIIDNMKRESFRNSVSGIIRTVEQNFSGDLDYDLSNGLHYTIENGILYLWNPHDEFNKQEIPYEGALNKATGQVIVKSDEKIYATVTYSKWCAIKKFDSINVEVYDIEFKEKCHDEYKYPNLQLIAVENNTNNTYVSDTWTSNNILLLAFTNSVDTANYKYTWYRNNEKITEENTETYIVNSEEESSKYKFSVTTSDGEEFFSNEIMVKIDKKIPTCDIKLTGNKLNSGWYVSNVKANISTTGSASGLKRYGISLNSINYYNNMELIIDNNGIYTIYGIVENNVGKTNNCSVEVKRDDVINLSATISGVLEGTTTNYENNTLVNSNVILTGEIRPKSNVSGYSYQWYKDNVAISGATSNIYKAVNSGVYYLQVITGSGIVGKSNSITVNIDTARPTCTMSIESGTKGQNDWYTSDVVVGMNQTDATYYGITNSSTVGYNNATSMTLNTTSTAYCYVANNSQTMTNSNSINVKIDKTAPVISAFSGASLSESNYNTKSLQLTVTSSDSESGIEKYEFYKIDQSYATEELLGTSTGNTYTISNPSGGYNYKVKVYNKAGLASENTITESCSLKTTTECSDGYKTQIYTCTTGRSYSAKTSEGCTKPTSSGGGSSCGGTTIRSSCCVYYVDSCTGKTTGWSCSCTEDVSSGAGAETEDDEIPD